MKIPSVLGLYLFIICFLHQSKSQRPGFHPLQNLKVQRPPMSKVMCTSDSLLIMQDCRLCVCPRPSRTAKCIRKSCDLRTKTSGQCPNAILRMDDNKLCPGAPGTGCRNDNECPGQQLCCMDFCRGSQCVNPVPLDPGMNVHRGLGYP